VEKCSPCHGEEGQGNGPQAVNLPEGISPSPLGDPVLAFKSTPTEWFSILTVGNIERFMPGFSSLSDAERWDVVAYAFSLSISDGETSLGQEIYQLHCSDCHGEDGSGTESGSALADPSFISNRTIEEFTAVIRDGSDRGMPGFGDELTDNELDSVSAYLMNLGFTGGVPGAIDEVATEPEELRSGMVSGQVINGTTDADIPEGLAVTFYGFEGQQDVIRENTVVDETGFFNLGEFEMQPGWVFVATAEHEGVVYGSEIVEFNSEEEIFLPLTVFDTSEDLSTVFVDRLHTIFSISAEGVLEVTELWIMSNTGDHTVATPDGVGIMEIPLPEGATNLQFDSGALGERFISTEMGFVDSTPMRPGIGTSELVFSFEVPYDKELDFRQAMFYSVDAIVLLTPATGPKLDGDGIFDMGAREMGGTLLHNYNAEPISAGGVFEVNIKGSGVDAAARDDSTLVTVGIGIGSLILAAGVVGMWWLRRREPSPTSDGLDEHQNVRDDIVNVEERERLLRSIADLDDAFEAGEIEEESYREERSELKARLLEIMQPTDHD
jgi:mono/diheme cytochrome c family protein